MSVVNSLASSLGRRDQEPNIAVGTALAERPDPMAVQELVLALAGDDGKLAGDASKALEELALRDPAQLAPHAAAIAGHLQSRNNRVVWGVATVLRPLAIAFPSAVAPHVGALMEGVSTGSVITQDHGVGALAATGDRAAMNFLLDHLRTCGHTHVALRAERVAPYVGDRAREFRDSVESRIPELTNSAAKRVRGLLASLRY